ncbi:ATP-binding protein [Catenovulum sp. 2E275]|uniref:ATP-binding protein n=1 Tax=Catenovulum sp. 2E275 TaxID=2980497 RepID=UPI0021CFCBF6|nr:ATP-binding protein [Catenovulum sp. 2E275]MCU4675828.1 ATP-binding protein [Catenovulum sp. 2E275]
MYAIGGIIPLILLCQSYVLSTEEFNLVAPARACYLLAWAAITWATFSTKPLFNSKTSLIIYNIVGAVFITYLNAFLTQNHILIVPSLLMFLIGIVIAQVGSKTQLLSGVVSFFIPLVLIIAKPQITKEDISVLVLIFIWAVIAWIASIILEQVNRRLFNYEQALTQANEHKQILLEKEEASNNFKSQFLANMSHEIRTPLTSIIGYAEAYINAEENKIKNDQVLNTIYINSKHLLTIANDILDLSKIEAGKLEVDIEETNLFALFQRVEQNQQALANQKGLNFSVSYSFPLPNKIMTDGTRLYQVLLNLTNNAIKFTLQGGIHVRVSYSKQSNNLHVKIKDTGIGMEQSVLDKLFCAFHQAQSSQSRKFGGTGLGLYISKELIEKLNGQINVSSEVGIGSEFSFTIKAEVSKSAVWESALPEIESYPNMDLFSKQKFKGTVLLAEDHPDNGRLIAQYLTELGLDVCLVVNGEQAIEKCLLLDFDLILMDIEMPVMDGITATGLIRKNNASIPVIALTANAMKKDIDSYLQRGFNGHLSKPIERHSFIQVLSQFLAIAQESEEDEDEFLFSIDSAEFSKMVAEYKDGLPEQIEILESAQQKNDWKQVLQIAHNIKGSAGNFGFNKLTEVAGLLEHSIRQNNIAEGQGYFAQLISELNQAVVVSDS